MSNLPEQVWSDAPNAPQIPSWLYHLEKEHFVGFGLGAISYGIAVALFFQCMATLLNPANPIRKGMRWALMAHTVAMLLFLTISVGIPYDEVSVEYIDNREFRNDQFPPGPAGYDDSLQFNAITTVFVTMFPLNQWLADGLLLHRCYVIYSMNHWAMAFPYLMYLASVVLGIANVYYSSALRFANATGLNIVTSYNSICLALNVLLTLMIVVRLIVHIRNVRKATETLDGSSGLHTAAAAVVTMLIESYALYAGILLAYTIPYAVNNNITTVFSEVICPVQVIAPYLITLRVAKRRALTSETISGTAGSIRFRSRGSTNGDGTLGYGDYTDATEANDETVGEIVTWDENAIEELPL